MDTKLNRIEDKLDKQADRVESIERILERNTASLEEHMKRSDLLETYVSKELEPLKAHVALMSLGFKGVMWFCGTLAGLAGFLYILKDLGVIRL